MSLSLVISAQLVATGDRKTPGAFPPGNILAEGHQSSSRGYLPVKQSPGRCGVLQTSKEQFCKTLTLL